MSKVLSALLVTLGLLLLTAGQAHAAAQCNQGPINEAGDINIAPQFPDVDCVVTGDVTGGGYIRINAPLGKITITGNITTTNHGNIVLSAGGPVSVGGSVIVNNASASAGQSGNVDIQANMSQAGAPFVIGGASSNGVANTIDVSTSAGGGNDPFIIKGGIRVRNRGDITVVSATALSVKATASKAGVIILDSVDGTLFLPAGTLSADGQPGQSAGAIVLMSHAIVAQDGTIISASDDGTAKLSHFVNIATESISYSGALTVRSNGGGSSTTGTGSFVYALPEFGIQIFEDSASNPGNFTWIVTHPFGTAGQRALTWNGAAGAPLTVTANGNTNTQLLMSGYPLTFNGGESLLASRGQTNHALQLTYTGATTGINGLQVNSSKLTLNANANANAGTGGDIFIGIPNPVSSSPQQVLATADGPTNAVGDGGNIDFFANGDITLGSAAGQFHLSAQGGTPGGHGGFANVQNAGHATNLATATAVQVSARGGNGDGGSFTAHSLTMSFAGSGLKVSADALGTGKGGQILWDVDGPISVGTGTGQVRLSADADAMVGGDGGQISIEAGSAEIAAGQLSVKSGPMGSGGQIGIFTDSDLSLTGSLKADAGSVGNGHGGAVTVVASGQLILNGSTGGGGQSLSADGAGTGAGGSVALEVQGNFAPTTIKKGQQGAISLSANGGNNGLQPATYLGAGGTIALTDLNQGFVIDGAAISVKSGNGQNAGTITVDAGQTLAVSGDIRAHGVGTGANGRTIRLTADSSNPVVFSGTSTTNIIADGGSTGTTGSGGHITIINAGTGDIVFQQRVVLSAAAEGSSGGEAGTFTGRTGGRFVFGATGSRIKANGNGSTVLDNISLRSAGGITIGSGSGAGEVELLAQGTAPGHRGGAIRIETDGPLTVAGGTILRTRPGANGSGGSITAIGRQVTVNNTAILEADGRGNGFPGTIRLEQTGPGVMMLDGATISASGDPDGDASGHDITIINSGPDTISMMNGTTLNANASLLGTGFGGSIHISSAAVVDLSQANIFATGAIDGAGGVVAAQNVAGRPVFDPVTQITTNVLNVSGVIHVDAGIQTPLTIFGGEITLNGIRCRQWKFTTDQSFPATYWNCVSPDTAPQPAREQIPAATGQLIPNAATRTLLADHRVNIFVFPSSHEESLFLADQDFPASLGFTFPGDFANPIEVAVYESCMNCTGHAAYAVSDPHLVEATAHELGHAVDNSMGNESGTASYIAYRNNDNLRLDFAFVDRTNPNNSGNSVLRLPCAPTPGFADAPPFVGVHAFPQPHLPAVPICVQDPSNPTGPLILNPVLNIPAGTENSVIFRAYTYRHSTLPSELYAQSFAFAVAPNNLDITFDELLSNGVYFECSLGRARQIALGAGNIPAYCLDGRPSWYPLQD